MSISPDLEARLLERLAGNSEALGAGYQAEVRLVALPEGEVVVKSPRHHAVLGFIARRALRREYDVYRHLDGITGIPRAHGLIDGDRLVLDYVDGPSLREGVAAITDRETFFGRLLDTIRAMHTAGVAHGDLKRKNNIVVGPGQQPYVIDFGIARLRDGGAIDRMLFGLVRQLDLNAWVKLKYGRRLEGLSTGDAAIYRPLLLERVARAIRVPWQKLTLRRPRQRWRKRRRERRAGRES